MPYWANTIGNIFEKPLNIHAYSIFVSPFFFSFLLLVPINFCSSSDCLTNGSIFKLVRIANKLYLLGKHTKSIQNVIVAATIHSLINIHHICNDHIFGMFVFQTYEHLLFIFFFSFFFGCWCLYSLKISISWKCRHIAEWKKDHWMVKERFIDSRGSFKDNHNYK